MKKLYLILLILSALSLIQLNAQCTPPEAETCDDANVLCSLDDLNGYQCQNNSTLASGCNPLCSQGGVPHNTGWWAFTSNGGNVNVTLTILGCTTGQGMQFGIWGHCDCTEEIACQSIPCVGNGSFTMSANLIPCKIYYLWVDGCSGDVCDFRITTSGGKPPELIKIDPINNDIDRIIEPVCLGACNYRFFVNPQPGGCQPTYIWELDGVEVGGNESEIFLDFPEEGDFRICVTAYIGNPQSGSICDQEGPVCATVRVRPIKERRGQNRKLCHEQIPYYWFGDTITQTGEYRVKVKDTLICCDIDSVVNFTVLDKPVRGEIFYVSCNGTPFIDSFGNIHEGCKNKEEIVLAKTVGTYKCDSSILLTSIYPIFINQFDFQCNQNSVLISSGIRNVTRGCGAGEAFDYVFNWYVKSDTSKKSIGSDDFLKVEIKTENYCLDLVVITSLGTQKQTCLFTYCEDIDETSLTPNPVEILGIGEFCSNEKTEGTYTTLIRSLDKIKPVWTVKNGSVIQGADSLEVKVLWDIPKGERGMICFSYESDCGTLPPLCKDIFVDETNAGLNDEIFSLQYKLKANDFSTGQWSKISGPGNVVFINPTDPKSRVGVNKFGSYVFRWTNKCPNGSVYDEVNILFKSKRDLPGDKKGNEGSSGTQKISSRDNNVHELNYTLFPNPVSGNLFNINRTSSEWPAQILLLNSQGKFLDSRSMAAGLKEYQWDCIDKLNAGLYFVICFENGNRQVMRFLVL